MNKGIEIEPLDDTPDILGDDHDSNGDHYLSEGLKYLHGLDGAAVDYAKAVSWFEKGRDAGSLSSGYMLCHCYLTGTGVPKDIKYVKELAEYLVQNYYGPANYFLFDIWNSGLYVPLHSNQAEVYYENLIRSCSKPVAGIPEVLRYDALLMAECLRNKIDARKLEKIARENLQISHLPTRFAMLGVALLRDIENSESAKEEVRQCLDEGCRLSEPMSLCFKGMLLCNEESPVFPFNEREGTRLLKRASEIQPAAFLIEAYVKVVENEMELDMLIKKMWQASTLGISGLPRQDELNCEITVGCADFSSKWHVYSTDVTSQLLNESKLDQLVTKCLPVIYITNRNSSAIRNVSVRICSRDVNTCKTIVLPNVIQAGETVALAPEEHGVFLGENLTVYVESNKRYSVFEVAIINGLNTFDLPIAPIILSYKSGTFGGIVLEVVSAEGALTNVVVHKSETVNCPPFSLVEGQPPQAIGWLEFSDSTGLQPQQEFMVTCDQYPSILATII